MSSEIKDRQQALQSAIRVLQNKKEEIQILKEKEKDFEMGVVNGSSIQEAKVVRRQSIIDYILGRVTKKDVNSANEVLFRAENDDKLTVEMIEELEAILKNMASQIPILQNAVEAARCKLWEGIYESIKREAQAKVGDLPVLAMAAGSRSGKQYKDALFDVFAGGSISFTVIDEAAKKLAKEFGLDD